MVTIISYTDSCPTCSISHSLACRISKTATHDTKPASVRWKTSTIISYHTVVSLRDRHRDRCSQAVAPSTTKTRNTVHAFPVHPPHLSSISSRIFSSSSELSGFSPPPPPAAPNAPLPVPPNVPSVRELLWLPPPPLPVEYVDAPLVPRD